MKLAYRVSMADYEEASWLAMRPRRVFLIAGILIALSAAASLIMSCYSLIMPGSHRTEVVILAMGTLNLGLIFFSLIPRLFRENYFKQNLSGIEAMIAICDEGLTVENALGEKALSWKSIRKWKANRKMIIVYIAKAKFMIFPLRIFPDANEFKASIRLLDEKVGSAIN